jgi:hypothetical protein
MPVVATGSLTIVDVLDGFTPYLVNDSITLAASATGVVSSYVGAETQFVMIEGGRDVTAEWTYYVNDVVGGLSFRDSDDTVDRTTSGLSLGGQNLVSHSVYSSTNWFTANAATGTLTGGIDDPFGGTNAARFTSNTSGAARMFVNLPNVTIPDGNTQTYTVSFFARLVSGTPNLLVDFADTNPSVAVQGQLVLGSWVRIQISGVPAASSLGVRNRIDFYNNTSNQVIDYFGVQLEAASTASELVLTAGAISTGARGYVRITDMVDDLGYLDIVATKFGRPSLLRRFSVAKARGGVQGPGGATGTRGTIVTARAITGTAWSDSEATQAIVDAGGIAPIAGDVVTLYNSASNFSTTRVRAAGSTWTVLAAFFGGNVLVDGTLAASKLVAGSVTTDKLAVGSQTNFIWNPCFAYSNDGWVPKAGVLGTVIPARTDETNWSLDGFGSGVWRPTGSTIGTSSYTELEWSPAGASGINGVPVLLGDKVAFQCEVITKGGVGVRLVCYSYDAAGVASLAHYGSAVYNDAPTNGRTLDQYTRMTAVFGLPAGAVRIGVRLRMINETGATILAAADPKIIVTRAALSVIHPNATVAPAWAPGGMTEITGGMIRADTITARNMSADSIETDHITAGAITAAEIASDTITANKLVLGDFLNRAEAPTFTSAGSWGVWSNLGAGGAFNGLPTGVTIGSNAANAYTGENYLALATGATSINVIANANVFPVTPGAIYLLRATARAVNSVNANLTIRLRFFENDKTTIVAPAVAGSGDLTFVRTTDTTYTSRSLTSTAVVVPAGAVWATIEIVPVASITTGEWRVGEVFVAMRNTADLIIDGAISAQKIAANSVTATKVMVGEVSNTYPDYDMMDTAFYSGDAFSLVGTNHASIGQNRLQITATDSTQRIVRSGWFTIEPTADYTVSGVAYVLSSGFPTTARLQIEFGSLDNLGIVTSTRLVDVQAATTQTSPTRATAHVTSASTERRARFVMTRSSDVGPVASFGGLMVRRRASGELIVDGAVIAAKVGAGAITAEKLAVTSPNNVVWNGTPGLTTDGWTALAWAGVLSGAVMVPSLGSAYDPTWVLGGQAGMVMTAASINNGSYMQTMWAPDGVAAGSMPCSPGDSIEVQGLAIVPVGFQAAIYATYYNSSGVEFAYGNYTLFNGVTQTDGRTKAKYTRLGGKSTAPAGAVSVTLTVRLINASGVVKTNPIAVFTQLGIGFGVPNQTELSTWTPGGTTNISGGVIRTGTIDTRTLKAESITAEKLKVGAVTASRISLSNASIFPDSHFDDFTSFWLTDAGGLYVDDTSPGNAPAIMGLRRAMVLWAGAFTGTAQKSSVSRVFGDVAAGQRFNLRARGWSSGTNRPIFVQLFGVDVNSNLVGSPSSLSWQNEGPSDKEVAYVAPTGVVRLVVSVIVAASASAWAGLAAVGNISVVPAVTATMITPNAISASHLRVDTAVITDTIQIANAVIKNANIDNGAITNAKIQNLEVDNAKIANLTLQSGKIVSNGISRLAEAHATNTVTYPGGSAPGAGQTACTNRTAITVEGDGKVIVLLKAVLRPTDSTIFTGGQPGEGPG